MHLAWGLWRSTQAVEQRDPASRNSFAKGLLLTLSNPKPVLFFAAFFPLFIPQSANTPLQSFATLGLVFEALNLAYFATLVMLLRMAGKQPKFSALSGRPFQPRGGHWAAAVCVRRRGQSSVALKPSVRACPHR